MRKYPNNEQLLLSIRRTFLLLFACFLFRVSFSQEKEVPIRIDSSKTVTAIVDSTAAGVQVKKVREYKPGKAALRSAILPGWGQIYNKKYWKLPIIYGAFAGLGYLISFNNKEYHNYNDALVARQDDDPETVDTEFAGKYSDENLRSLSDYYHRNRDLSILLTVLVYSLNVMDAHVDAHLYSFDVSEDLSLHVDPVMVPASYYGINTYRPGLGISLKF